MLLAVVLMFSALPVSVSADEISSELPTESSVESQPEETEEPAQTNGTISISDSSGDVPVLYAQDSFSSLKSDVEGGVNYMTSYGVTRQSIVRGAGSPRGRQLLPGDPPTRAATLSPPTGTPVTTATLG